MTVSKVLHVIPSVGPLRGGPTTTVRNLARGLSRAGIETHVVTTDDNGEGRLDVPCGVPVAEEGATFWYFPRQARCYTFSWPLSEWLARHIAEFDIVHVHALFSFATLPAAFWARRNAVPYIVRPLGTLNEWGMRHRRRWLKRLSFSCLERRILKHAALVHYTSERERAEAENHGVRTTAAILPNALPDLPELSIAGRFRSHYPLFDGRLVVLFLSRLDRVKGLELLLEAFAQTRQYVSNASLVIAGDGDVEFVNQLKAQAAALGIAADVHWLGFLAGEQKQAALADSDVFVLASHSESFGIAAAEAMAAGVPVVVSDQVAIHGDITRAQAGIVVPREVDELSAALTRLLSDVRLRKSMGHAGRTFARQQYSSSAVTRQLIALYNEIAT